MHWLSSTSSSRDTGWPTLTPQEIDPYQGPGPATPSSIFWATGGIMQAIREINLLMISLKMRGSEKILPLNYEEYQR
jgi:hypothetical protein